MSRRIKLALAAILVALTATVAGCSASSVDTSHATIIDVRTPAEYAQGHLRGAVNIDVQATTFASQIAALPQDGTYLLYCRSGARAGQAKTIMNQAGFTDVTNLGSLQAASSSTGLPIVTT